LGAQAQVAANATADTVEQVTVTARKFAERAQDVPASISVFTPAEIEAAHIESLGDVVAELPGVSTSTGFEPGLLFFNVRGIGQVLNGEPPMAVVVDGVQLYDIDQITQGLYDLKSIEVLQGPQGAIYGRDAIGGAINITTASPTDELSGWASQEYGTGNDVRLQGSVSGAIIPDELWFRAAGSLRWFDGDIKDDYLDKDVNGEISQSGRFSLLAQPMSHLSFDFEASASDAHSGAAWYSPVPPGDGPNTILPVDMNIPGRSERLLRTFSLKTDYDFSGLTLTSISAFSLTDTSIYEDFDFLPQNYLSGYQVNQGKTTSQEFRLSSSPDSNLRWMVGATYYNIMEYEESILYLMPGAGGVFVPFPITTPVPASVAGAGDFNNAYALFGQVQYNPIPEIALTAALRYDADSISNTNIVSGVFTHSDFSAAQPQFTAAYTVSPNALVYASAGEGFRSGGFNASTRITPVYKSETDWSYELGAKTNWFSERLTANIAAYYTEDDNTQIYIFDQLSASETITNPVTRAHIAGTQLDVTAVPLSGWQIQATGGYQGTRIDSYDTSVFAGLPAAGNFTGNKLPQVPDYTYSLNTQYTMPVGDEVSLTGRTEFNGSGGDYYWNVDDKLARAAVNNINLRLSLDYDSYSATIFAENVTDKKNILEYEQQSFTGAPLGNYNLKSPGRVLGITLKERF
jgi:iron complex outermembrane receptor protein